MLVQKLQLSLSRCYFSVGALNNLTTTVNGTVSITFKSVYNEYKRTLNFLVVPNITDCLVTDLKTLIEQFWTVEELSYQSALSQEEIECEAHFKQHVTRDKDGRYIVALPFRTTMKTLGESKQTALKRLSGLQKRFDKDPDFKKQYSAVIQEYLQLIHMPESKSRASFTFLGTAYLLLLFIYHCFDTLQCI